MGNSAILITAMQTKFKGRLRLFLRTMAPHFQRPRFFPNRIGYHGFGATGLGLQHLRKVKKSPQMQPITPQRVVFAFSKNGDLHENFTVAGRFSSGADSQDQTLPRDKADPFGRDSLATRCLPR